MNDWTPLIFTLTVPLALCIDHFLGEPQARWHPVVWMGSYLGTVGRKLVPQTPPPMQTGDILLAETPKFRQFWLGAFFWSVGVAIVCVAAVVLQRVLLAIPESIHPALGSLLAVLLLAVALKPMLSWRMLRDEVSAVEAALQQSLAAGRERLSMLVSRDTTLLSESEVRESAIESLAENLNDSVVAPIFWFVLFGLPGAAVYRFANTADAMWGYRGVYKGQNWEWAGKWAARADDVLSWLPARLTAVLMWLVSGGFQLAVLRREAARTPSPNSGWPMAAMALALGVCLRKPGVYALNAAGRAPQAADTSMAVRVALKVLFALLPCAFVAIGLIAFVLK